MKLNLFLSVALVFTVFHLCKAGPLRHLEKRAIFYIANETACVVDDKVYSSGDPIPTDDPCESCKCRPPGFACVLTDCKIKPGCRAVRHAQQCCPEYICGCEHSGRFYKDGDEIQDPKNPCYKCHCQGSSIACAFVDCIYRDECDNMFVPGECCPQYTNCTKDTPDRNLFEGGNALPPVNLLPAFNDETFLSEVEVLTTEQVVELTENPIQLEGSNDNSEELSPEKSESEDAKSTTKTIEPENLENEGKKLDTEVEEKNTEPLESSKEEQILSKESPEEIKILNSESEINKEDVIQNSESQEDDKLQPQAEKELPQTTVASKPEEKINEAEVTEKPLEIESTSKEITEKDQPIQNSASENSKSLKLSENDQLEETEKKQQDIQLDKETNETTTTEWVTEAIIVDPIDDLKRNSTIESKKQFSGNVPGENQTNPQATIFRMNNPKIKSESAETVTIVVHVKEGSKLQTETDFVAETVTLISITNATEENLLKSSDEIINTNSNKESSEPEKSKSTTANFEIFPTKEEISEITFTSKSPSVDQNSEDISEKLNDADNITLDAKESLISEEKASDSKNGNDSSVTTIIALTEVSNEARTDEEISEGESITTTTETDVSKPITIEIITDSVSSPKPETTTTALEDEKTEELTIEKEPKSKKNENNTKETAAEIREDSTELDKVKVDVTTPVQSVDEVTKKEEKFTQAEKTESTTEREVQTSEGKAQETTPTNIVDKPELKANEEIQTEKSEETTIKNVEDNKVTEENKVEASTESQNQETEELKQTSPIDN